MGVEASRALVFLCSGGGGNLRFVHEAIRNGWILGLKKIVVIADRECAALEYARQKGLEASCLDFNNSDQHSIIRTIDSYSPAIVITTIHRILLEDLVSKFHDRIINLHYSLLPAFAGAIGVSPIKSAIDYGVRLGGATVHKVINKLDSGQPLVQAAMPYGPDDSVEEIMDLEFRIGCISLLMAIQLILQTKSPKWGGALIKLKGRNIFLNPFTSVPNVLLREDFWASIK